METILVYLVCGSSKKYYFVAHLSVLCFVVNLFYLFLWSVTLKNAAELLEFAAMYNAEQLKLSCLQFIVLNMAALLEAK